ncbi:hypothetical protein OE88DRAFT_671584 [Heliocybe sulcata]|uniref:Oxidase ustYa n=1 Tax=Heliocybe sulcata TaxID=5364 RepID=A0A5C3NDT1_9AGAM|nr:hypothetical protein OE88DRAFT_671584 [Heliocybe sulcata]
MTFAMRLSNYLKPLPVALAALFISTCINLLAVRRLRGQKDFDDSHFSYLGEDYPTHLPIYLPSVALTIEDTTHFGISDPDAWPEWRSTDYFPRANGFVRLGPMGRPFGIAMFHQMHCLQMMREAVLKGDSNYHVHHCFNLIRQALLCASDTTLDPIDVSGEGIISGADGIGTTHVCRDWTKVYDFVYENQRNSIWNSTT